MNFITQVQIYCFNYYEYHEHNYAYRKLLSYLIDSLKMYCMFHFEWIDLSLLLKILFNLGLALSYFIRFLFPNCNTKNQEIFVF